MDIVQDDGTDSFDCNEFVDEVSSWIHDERRCVTTQTVAWTFGLSRRQASQVLTKCCIPSPSDRQDHDTHHAKSSYKVVWMQADEETNSDGTRLTVVKFIKSTLSALEIQQQEEQSKQQGRAIYAISFNDCTESLTTAHTKDQQLFRDALQSQQHATVLNHNCIEIQSSIDLDRHDVGQFQQERRNHMGQVATDRPGAARTTSGHNDYNQNKTVVRKTTTAQAFFRGSSSTTTTTSTPTTKHTDHHPTQAKTKKPFFGTSSVSKSTITTTSTTTTTTKQGKAKEKEKQMRATSSVEKENAPNVAVVVGIGTADDFMGDVDEDEEFLQQEKLRQDRRQQETQRASSSSSSHRSGRPEPPQPQSKSACTSSNMAAVQVNDNDDDDDDNHHHLLHGVEHEPQTSRQQKQQPPPPPPPPQPPAVVLGKKRRKKLVEKTTMDAHGYMHTETHVEWEEMDVVDEPITTVEKKKKVVKNTKNMKQGSLMGFFAKK